MGAYIIQLPKQLKSRSMYHFIDQLVDEEHNPKYQEVVFDFSTLGFVDSVGMTVFSNIIELLSKRGTKYEFINHLSRTDALRFLDDSMFFSRYLGAPISELASVRSTTVPLQCISHADSHFWLDQNLVSWLMARLNLSRSSLATFKVCLQELFNNISDHSGENIGCIFLQHWPNDCTIRVALSDFGVGIPKTISRVKPGLSDGDALYQASLHGVTSKSRPGNHGAGLDILISNVVGINCGEVRIFSNRGLLTCAVPGEPMQRVSQSVAGFYPGTLFEITLRTDTIEQVDDDEREDLEW